MSEALQLQRREESRNGTGLKVKYLTEIRGAI
jgi:hypothetical protein